jgi:hypothetical protein
MAKLPSEISETIWTLKRQLLDLVEEATTAEYALFDRFGETERTISYLDELKSVAEQATDRFSQFSRLQVRMSNSQPIVPRDMLELVTEIIANTQNRLPALERSIQEIKTEWRLL